MAGKRGRPKKRPKAQKLPPSEKTPSAAADIDHWSRNPVWRISTVEWHSPWGWAAVDATTAKRIYERLSNFESMTWNEILVVGRKRNHAVRLDAIIPDARSRLEDLGLDDVDRIYSSVDV